MAEQHSENPGSAMTAAAVTPSLGNALPYFVSLPVFPLLAFAAFQGGWWIAAPYLYFLIPDVFDALSGADERNIDPKQTLEDQLIWYKLSLWAWGILWPITFVFSLWQMLVSDHLSMIELAAMAFVVTTVAQVSFIVGHELIHRRAVWERRLAEVILSSVSYPTYASEHIFIHHALACTPGDPGSAPRGVSFWSYLPREILSNLTSAWRFQQQRLARRQLPVWHYTNPFWRYVGITAAWYALVYWMGGPWAVLVYALLCTGVIMSMKLINYVQHYGLRRIRLPNGRYERVRSWHSWSAAYKLSNWFFYNMQRHPDHHISPGRRYPLLQHCGEDAAPQLPGAYVEMAGLALFPRRWFQKMDPLVDRWREHFYPDVDDWSAYDSPATAERPEAFEEIAEIFASAPRLAAWIDRAPELLDNLKDREFTDLDLPNGFGPNPESEAIARCGLTRLYWTREFDVAEMRERIADYPVQDVRETVNAVRNWSNDKVFQIGMHTLRANLTPVEAGIALSNIAEASIGAVLAAIDEDFASRGAAGGLAVVVLGDVASGEAAPHLELRLLLVYEGTPPAPYAELCRRIHDALSGLTLDNLLFAPLPREGTSITATSLAEFLTGDAGPASYLEELSVAKCIYTLGDAAIEQQFEAARREVLTRVREQDWAIAEPDSGSSVGAKTLSPSLEPERGGLEDVERAARSLRLKLNHGDDAIRPLDAAAVFRTAGEHALIPSDAAEGLAQAASFWRNLHGIRRLIADGAFDIESAGPGVRKAITRACGMDDFDALSEAVSETASRTVEQLDSMRDLLGSQVAKPESTGSS